jgi:hypothetical protein|tara:strand:+ start:273 stop:773 length:501 start_codon:yes stop_codon:yes gene_type:complete
MSTLHVENLKGLSSGSNANKIIVPSGQELHAAGHVIQVVNGLLTTGASNNTASFVDSGLTATITPKFATSKILVAVTIMSVENNTATEGTHVKLVRGSTDLSQWGQWMGYTRTYMNAHPSLTYLDSPATTSATTYKVQFKRGQGSGISYIGANSSTSSMTLMEIAQ